MVELARFDDAVVAVGEAERVVVLQIFLRHAGHAVAVVDRASTRSPRRRRNVVGHEIDVEVAVQIVVGKADITLRAGVVEAKLLGAVLRTCRRRG